MIKYSSSLLGLYAEVENSNTKESFRVTTFNTPYGIYETDVFRAVDLSAQVKDVYAVKPLFVEYPPTSEEAQKSHKRIAELFEQLTPDEAIRELNKASNISAKSQRVQKINILKQLINKKT